MGRVCSPVNAPRTRRPPRATGSVRAGESCPPQHLPPSHTIRAGDVIKNHLPSGRASLGSGGYLLDRNGHREAGQAAPSGGYATQAVFRTRLPQRSPWAEVALPFRCTVLGVEPGSVSQRGRSAAGRCRPRSQQALGTGGGSGVFWSLQNCDVSLGCVRPFTRRKDLSSVWFSLTIRFSHIHISRYV